MFSKGMCCPLREVCGWRAPAVCLSDWRAQQADCQPTVFFSVLLQLMVPHGTVALPGTRHWGHALVCDRQMGLYDQLEWLHTSAAVSTVIVCRHTLSSNMSEDKLLLFSCQNIGFDLFLFVWLFNEFVDTTTITLNGTTCRKVLVVMLMLILKQCRQVTTLCYIWQNPTFKDKLSCVFLLFVAKNIFIELLWRLYN